MSTRTFLTCTGLLLLGTLPAFGQDKKETPRLDERAREKRVQELMEQQRKIMEELAREGAGRGGLPPGFPGGRPPGGPGAPGPDIEAMRKMMQEQMAKMMEEARSRGEPGPGLPSERMQDMLRQGMPPGGRPAGAGPLDPQAMLAQQMAAMLRMSEAGTGPLGSPELHDPLEMGQRMVLAGLEAQLRGMAERIRKTTDPEARDRQTGEFKELIGKLSDARRKRREKQIEQLEKKLAELKEQKDEPADEIARRLLDEEPATERPAAEKPE